MSIDQFLKQMWNDYCALNPDAPKICDLLRSVGETIQNDHIAIRTFRHRRLGLESAIRQFEKLGYQLADQEYFFKAKKLYARHLVHADQSYPKVFVSELETEKMSSFVIETLNKLADQIPEGLTETPEFYFSGRPWTISHATYDNLKRESEYAAWVAAFGFRPNHFTVNVNDLHSFKDLNEVNAFLKSHGFVLNQSGGEIKGSPSQLLEQSSTMAPLVPMGFSEGSFLVPGCYYEFAKRYRLPNGELYSGFVAESADRIFESTNKLS